jgi:hypothetical protein
MRKSLRLLVISVLWAGAVSTVDAQNTAINVTGAAPNTKAILDVDVSGITGAKRGMLVPRMTFAQRLNITGLAALETGMLVYQTDDGVDPDPTLASELAHGFFYWDGAAWVRWASFMLGWRLNGNVATAANFLGTVALSNDDLHIRTTNTGAQPQMLISATNGFVGVNPIAAPVERLDINGGLKVGNTALNTEGAIKFDNAATTPNRWHYGNINGTAAGWQRLENAETRITNQPYRPITLQCQGADGSLVKGVYDGTPVAGNPNTPFATNTGLNNRRGHRVQYIYPASELLAAGLCQGPITKFSFYALSNDQPIVGATPGSDILVDVRMGNSLLANFGAFTASSPVPLAVNWDAATEGSGNINQFAATAILVQLGWVDFTLSGAGFPWDGTSNLILDISWARSATIGLSPAVQLEEGLPYTATKWVQVTANADINHGRTYQDNPLTVNATTGNTNSRPVTRFFGRVQTPGFAAADLFSSYLNYAGGMVVDTNASPVTWADANYRGPGSIRARVAVYDGNTFLSDHVFDKYYDGDVKPEDQQASQGFAYIGVNDLKGHLKEKRHLPNMPSRKDWDEHGAPSIGELQTGLWESVESQALHIIELEKDLRALESLAFGHRATAAELEALLVDVRDSRRMSEAQKLHLTAAIRNRLTTLNSTK